jgi:hypothetical protein
MTRYDDAKRQPRERAEELDDLRGGGIHWLEFVEMLLKLDQRVTDLPGFGPV